MRDDVRMRGFAGRADVAEVERFLAERSGPLGAEPVALARASGRVLAQAVTAARPVPPFRRAAMDGYALRGEESFGASAYDPVELRVVGTALPARPYPGRLAPGEALRIMTGAPLPEGADAVAPAEICEESGGRVRIHEPVPPRRHVGEVGEDVRPGEVLLACGRRLRPQDLGLLASLGLREVACVRRPRVSLLVTGDEVVPPGTQPGPFQIVDSNSPVLRALVERDGGELVGCRWLPDREERLRGALREAAGEVVLVSGGSSVGQEDHAPRIVAELGRLDFHGIAMRPSSPTGIGRLEGRWVFLLPGNPVSCLCAYEFFAGPTIRALGGRSRRWPHRRLRLPLARKLVSMVGRVDYVRVAIERGRAVPLATSGASILSSTVRADGCVLVPRDREGMDAGEEVEVLLYDQELPEGLTGEAAR